MILDDVRWEKVNNGYVLIFWYEHDKQQEYYPTVGALAQRINDFFNAEKEGIEIKPIGITKGDEF